jgi:hypothetical protein
MSQLCEIAYIFLYRMQIMCRWLCDRRVNDKLL